MKMFRLILFTLACMMVLAGCSGAQKNAREAEDPSTPRTAWAVTENPVTQEPVAFGQVEGGAGNLLEAIFKPPVRALVVGDANGVRNMGMAAERGPAGLMSDVAQFLVVPFSVDLGGGSNTTVNNSPTNTANASASGGGS